MRRVIAHLQAHPRRIALEFIGPSLVGVAFLFVIWAVGFAGDLVFGSGSLQSLYFFLGVSAVVAPGSLAPGFIYAVAMECAFVKGDLSPRSWKAVGLSTGLGSFAGLAVGLMAGLIFWPHGVFDPKLMFRLGVAFTIYGTVVGFMLGLILRFDAPRPSALLAGET